MKRLILTSICTLVLSLLGAFGLNQNNINTNTDQALAATAASTSNTDNQSLKKAPASDTFNNVQAQEVTAKTVKSNNDNRNGFIVNRQAMYYKNVNLSNCKSVRDVVKVLRKNGYTKITAKNIKNIKALQGILAIIEGNRSGNCSTRTTPSAAPAPTTTPAPTAKPAPTTAPAPTAKPAPTTAPAPTAKPAPTAAPAPTAKPAPTVVPTPTKLPSDNNSGISSFSGEVLRLVNIERAKAGLSAYTTTSAITSAADKRAREIKQSFSHTRPDGTSCFTVLAEYGVSYRACGENIAYGQKTPQQVVTGWMNSPGHRANILNPNFNKIGIGVYESNGILYWVQEFTN